MVRDNALAHADLVITGEGRLDSQTAGGKGVAGVLGRASARGVPVIAICGAISGDVSSLGDRGLAAAYALVTDGISAEYAMRHAAELLERLTTDAIV